MVELIKMFWLLDDALSEHRVCNLYETGDICTADEIAFAAIFGGCLADVFVNCLHNRLQLGVGFFE